jgi:2-polyprenyl-6-hydroxyphenyl methylase/3-demethylubiquinone-9 3-methyltransferase
MERSGTASAEQRPWALGDYHRFAKQLIWGFGPELVAACGIRAGHRVLDVATGSGNVALRAAQAGADVVASDITPENFEAGRREAREMGVELEWVQADAQALPFGDAGFDVVTSSVGAMFAPDHQAVADEMLRVCRPGGTLGLITYPPEGMVAGFFGALAPYMPASDDPPPLLWGDPEHVRALFGDRVAELEMTRHSYVERSPGGPREYCELCNETFGPIVGLRAGLDPERRAALDRDFLAFATRENHGPPEGPAHYDVDYLRVVARKVG